MRPIKFRGRDLKTGEYIFGFYTTGSGDKPFILVTNAQGQYLREVKPDSVAQLAGYDANGNEVYEGDTFEFNGQTYTCRLTEQHEGDLPTGELCTAIIEVIQTSRPVRLWLEGIAHAKRIEGESATCLPNLRQKLSEAIPAFKAASERFIAAYQNIIKESEADQ